MKFFVLLINSAVLAFCIFAIILLFISMIYNSELFSSKQYAITIFILSAVLIVTKQNLKKHQNSN